MEQVVEDHSLHAGMQVCHLELSDRLMLLLSSRATPSALTTGGAG
jgi:hypothetical protein